MKYKLMSYEKEYIGRVFVLTEQVARYRADKYATRFEPEDQNRVTLQAFNYAMDDIYELDEWARNFIPSRYFFVDWAGYNDYISVTAKLRKEGICKGYPDTPEVSAIIQIIQKLIKGNPWRCA